ncbi:hypothetical protein [Paraglaciecola aestuariivivens]
MNKTEFLSNRYVQDFIGWLSHNIDSGISHTWYSLGAGKGFSIGEKWSCKGIFNAHAQYKWKSKRFDTQQPIITFEQTRDYLNNLGSKLTQAVTSQNHALCFETCIEILEWGGVNDSNIAINIRELKHELALYLTKVQAFLNSNELNSAQSFEYQATNGKVYGLHLDSGTTKIYSLLANEFIIYDSRVGAALGLLVSKWMEDTKLAPSELPQLLTFTWGSARRKVDGVNPIETRNPNNGKRLGMKTFAQAASTDPLKRFADNIHTSWLLSALLANPKTCGQFAQYPVAERIHAFESALFMLGYAVSNQALSDMHNRFALGQSAKAKPQAQNKVAKPAAKTGQASPKRLTNHSKLLHHIKTGAFTLPATFEYRHVYAVASQLKLASTAAGRDYACIKFIQSFCTVLHNDLALELSKLNDPRQSAYLTTLRQGCQFQLAQL